MSFKPPTKGQKIKLSKLLAHDEKVILVTSIGTRYFWIKLFFTLLLPLSLFCISLLMFSGFFDIPGYSWIKFLGIFPFVILILNLPKFSHLIRMRQSYVYALTNRRFVIIRGIFSRKIVTAPLDRITHITIEQSLSQRYLYNTGHLVIITAGFDQREIVIENIASPVAFKILVEELTQKLEEKKDKMPEFNLRALTT